MLSPARLKRARLEAQADGDPKRLAALKAKTPAKTEPRPAPPPTLAQRHRDRSAGALAVLAGAAAANDNDGAGGDAREPTPAVLQRLAMAEDRRQLKTHQSVEARIALKRTLLPKYEAYVVGLVEAGAEARHQDPSFRAPQDDVVMNVLIWLLDVGELDDAVRIFDFALTHGWAMPANFKRNLQTFVAEQAAEFALQELEAGRPVSLMALSVLEELVRDRDMPDEVRARLHKAIGRELMRRASEAPADGEANQTGSRKARLEAALEQLTRARDLDDRSGCKGDIQRIERELKKTPEDPPAAAEPPATDTPPTPAVEAAPAGEPVVIHLSAEPTG